MSKKSATTPITKHPITSLAVAAISFLIGTSFASASNIGGSIFVTGHDPDFHADVGGNGAGAAAIIDHGLNFVRNGNTAPILFIETSPANNALGDHVDSELGLVASGYTAGTAAGNHYVKVSASEFLSVNLSAFSAILIPSDHGGSLTGNDLQAINARTADILAYLNAGGGLMALAEDGFRTAATTGPQPGNFAFLPFLVTASPLSEFEGGNTLTAYGASLGLSVNDINGNYSHNIFTATGGMTPVDYDAGGEILSLAYRGNITINGVPDVGSTFALLGMSLSLLPLGRRLNK